MNQETTLQQRIRLACCRGRARLFRNNVGALRDANTGRLVRFGLAQGSADLVGWRTITIGPEHVGQRLAQFVSLEVKLPGSLRRTRPAQVAWQQQVQSAGGLAVIVDSEAAAVAAIEP
jgi:hypothetical protein